MRTEKRRILPLVADGKQSEALPWGSGNKHTPFDRTRHSRREALVPILPAYTARKALLTAPQTVEEMPKAKDLTLKQRDALLTTLRARFEAHKQRHPGLEWTVVQTRLESNSAKLWSLNEMERSGGEPDVVGADTVTGEVVFVDCSAQSPDGRRSLCYDRDALLARKEHKPKSSAVDMATAMGAALLSVDEYQRLQELGEFDTKTSTWVQTPTKIRKLGGALFCDRRYDTVFVYHNGADAYYAARGFRCSLKV